MDKIDIDKFELAELVQHEDCTIPLWQARTGFTMPTPDNSRGWSHFDWAKTFSSLEKAEAALLERPGVRKVGNRRPCGQFEYDVERGKAEIIRSFLPLRTALRGNLKLLGYTIECPAEGRTYTYRGYPELEE